MNREVGMRHQDRSVEPTEPPLILCDPKDGPCLTSAQFEVPRHNTEPITNVPCLLAGRAGMPVLPREEEGDRLSS